jgi:MFS superfamily sulfate permease-like transporter
MTKERALDSQLADKDGGSSRRSRPPPRGDLAGLRTYWRADASSGFLVFLIALPLCLGISIASGYPPMAGIITAIVGALITPWLSNSELTIKGPAAGLIVIALGTITELAHVYGAERAYALALGVGVAAGLLQVVFAVLRTGILGDFFPTSAVHGMLAAIGVIIIAKQLPVTLGVMNANGSPLELLGQIPSFFAELNPAIALIGVVSLVILFGMPRLRERLPWSQKVPAPMLVIAVAIPLGIMFDLSREHQYTFFQRTYELSERFLVPVPKSLFGALTTPDFTALGSFVGWKWAILFAVIGSLESLLSSKAVDMLDPYQRRTNLDRDLLAVSAGNTVAASIGGLPMISEIVRSRANVDNGGQTRFANFFHGVFLFGCVALVPWLIQRIPLAALSAMLVYTGFRLASPREFRHALETGREELLVFVGTLVAVLATDLLVGIGLGIGISALIHRYNGVPLRVMFRPRFEVDDSKEDRRRVTPLQEAVFSNWIPLRRRITEALNEGRGVTVDLSRARVVDHTTMVRLDGLIKLARSSELELRVEGLEEHHGHGEHPLAARRHALAQIRRLTVVAPATLEGPLRDRLLALGASGYTATPGRGAGRRTSAAEIRPVQVVRLELLLPPDLAERSLALIRMEFGEHPLTTSLETVEVARAVDFAPQDRRLGKKGMWGPSVFSPGAESSPRGWNGRPRGEASIPEKAASRLRKLPF